MRRGASAQASRDPSHLRSPARNGVDPLKKHRDLLRLQAAAEDQNRSNSDQHVSKYSKSSLSRAVQSLLGTRMPSVFAAKPYSLIPFTMFDLHQRGFSTTSQGREGLLLGHRARSSTVGHACPACVLLESIKRNKGKFSKTKRSSAWLYELQNEPIEFPGSRVAALAGVLASFYSI